MGSVKTAPRNCRILESQSHFVRPPGEETLAQSAAAKQIGGAKKSAKEEMSRGIHWAKFADAAGVVSSQKNVVDSIRMWDTVNDICLKEYMRRATRNNKSAISATLLLGVLAFALTLSACEKNDLQKCGDNDAAWRNNLALWKSKGVADYDMEIERFKGGMYPHVPFLMKVRSSQNISRVPARENAGLEKTDGYEEVTTVEGMFETTRLACERGDKIKVEYDLEFGLPKSFGYDSPPYSSHSLTSFKVIKFQPVAK